MPAKGSAVKTVLFVFIFGLSCFEFFLHFLSQGYSYMVCQHTVGQITLSSLHVWKIKTVEILMLNSKEMTKKEFFVLILGDFVSARNSNTVDVLVNLNLLVTRCCHLI